MFVSLVNNLCSAISLPWSYVRVNRNCFGRVAISLVKAFLTNGRRKCLSEPFPVIGKAIFCSGKTDNPQWVRLLKGKHVLRYWFHIKSKHADVVRKAFTKEMATLPKQLRLTLTYDQGREMAEHKLFTKDTNMQVYFAHPASPWERGTNENTNGLIRQFFPKGTDFKDITSREIKKVQDMLNGRPRTT